MSNLTELVLSTLICPVQFVRRNVGDGPPFGVPGASTRSGGGSWGAERALCVNIESQVSKMTLGLRPGHVCLRSCGFPRYLLLALLYAGVGCGTQDYAPRGLAAEIAALREQFDQQNMVLNEATRRIAALETHVAALQASRAPAGRSETVLIPASCEGDPGSRAEILWPKDERALLQPLLLQEVSLVPIAVRMPLYL